MSALKEPEVVDNLIQNEVSKGYMIVPFRSPLFALFHINPIGITTRKYTGKKRLIIDLSSPHNSTTPSINSLIPEDIFFFVLCFG